MPRTATKIISPATLRAKHTGYVLPNGVKCVIVQDPNAKIPAAAMSIAAGQLNDPPQLPGLAHFCEHMLFMGTEKFPKDDEYDSYISRNNGFHNAFTSHRATVFYFQVSDGALDGALERFVEFFVAPTFDESAVNREVRAVHSEDEKNHSVDYWRSDEVMRGLYNSKHPRSRYGNGNETTLVREPTAKGIRLREALKSFYAENYASEAACIAICSSRDPEEVLGLIEEPLLRMRPGKGPSFRFIPEEESVLRPGVVGSWLNLKSINKTRCISVQWPVKCSSKLWKSVPSAYISHIVAHECDSSVLGVLKKRDWATDMVAGAATLDDDYEIFNATISLTLSGLRHIAEVIGLLYEYIGLAVNDGVDMEVYNQMKAEERLSFESQEVSSAASHCVFIAQNAAETDLEHCIIGGACILEDNIEETLTYAKQLTPSNGLVVFTWGSLPSDVAPEQIPADAIAEEAEPAAEEGDEDEGEGEEDASDEKADGDSSPEKLFASLPEYARKPADRVARFHKAQHSRVQIPESQLEAWQDAMVHPKCVDLKLPSVNPFIATDFTVFPSASDVAEPEIFVTPHGTTIARKDAHHHNTFNSSVTWSPISPVTYATALNRLYTQVMGSILEDNMTELSYYGALASLENRIVRDVGGPGFTVTGPYQQLPTFFSMVLDRVLDAQALKGTQEKFDTYREQYIRKMEGRSSAQPYEHAIERSMKIACLVSYTFEDILAAAPSATYAGYTAFVDEFLSYGLLFECFMAGNMPSAKAMVESTIAIVEEKLRSANIPVPNKDTITRYRDSLDLAQPNKSSTSDSASPASALATVDVLALPPFNPEDPNVCTILQVYVGELEAKSAALCSVAEKMISSLFFNALRTKETLGYIVFAQYRPLLRGASIVFGAQSADAGVDGLYLLSRIVAFLAALEGRLDKLCTAEETDRIAAGLIQGLEQLPDSVKTDASELRHSYVSSLGLDNRAKMIEVLKALTAEEVRDFMQAFVLNSRTDARGLALIVASSRTKDHEKLTEGKRMIALPALRETPTEDGEAAAAEALVSTEDNMTLPTFKGVDSAAFIEVNVLEGIRAYREGRAVLRNDTF